MTTSDHITPRTYECGCDYRDGEQTRWCAHHVSGLQETIRARDKSIAEYSTKVRVLEKSLAEWKAKAEQLEGIGQDYNDVVSDREELKDGGRRRREKRYD